MDRPTSLPAFCHVCYIQLAPAKQHQIPRFESPHTGSIPDCFPPLENFPHHLPHLFQTRQVSSSSQIQVLREQQVLATAFNQLRQLLLCC
ncbi:hypothetical protein NUU61_001334 [Penicillium alfredii]|uniref:Uncharacterized protein n=1 Tax=Penicillium alfredii TaxID=1506179 RepID=A0A9W9KLZ7_9EURO|nr:uncharacterized protein NUU61_001334 [Penicillium alfredii]KAJ5111704.1 hypothetical protein NUU61_001334 [Penicillium alfredii]